ncbi:MAG: hypothetical protein M1355_00575 [Patescibacteria group bacterium]|nr:hypothetical protein [Patescibacteria group bacterium]MCL5093621.1 hypothetical protein [Patescibacteria group bacterium]
MEIFNNFYDIFLNLFPRDVQWLVSLIVVISLIAAFYVLVRYHWGFLLLIVIFLPIAIPALRSFFADVYGSFLYIWDKIGLTITISPSK